MKSLNYQPVEYTKHSTSAKHTGGCTENSETEGDFELYFNYPINFDDDESKQPIDPDITGNSGTKNYPNKCYHNTLPGFPSHSFEVVADARTQQEHSPVSLLKISNMPFQSDMHDDEEENPPLFAQDRHCRIDSSSSTDSDFSMSDYGDAVFCIEDTGPVCKKVKLHASEEIVVTKNDFVFVGEQKEIPLNDYRRIQRLSQQTNSHVYTQTLPKCTPSAMLVHLDTISVREEEWKYVPAPKNSSSKPMIMRLSIETPLINRNYPKNQPNTSLLPKYTLDSSSSASPPHVKEVSSLHSSSSSNHPHDAPTANRLACSAIFPVDEQMDGVITKDDSHSHMSKYIETNDHPHPQKKKLVYNPERMAATVPDLLPIDKRTAKYFDQHQHPSSKISKSCGITRRVYDAESELLERRAKYLWYDNERQAFEQGLREYGRRFSLISEKFIRKATGRLLGQISAEGNRKVKVKSRGDIVCFYYMHKHAMKWKVKHKVKTAQKKKADKEIEGVSCVDI